MRDSQHYRLGPAVLRLGEGFQSSRELLEVAQPALASLRDQLDWSAHLGVIDGRHLLYLVRQPASRWPVFSYSCWHPLACCDNGDGAGAAGRANQRLI